MSEIIASMPDVAHSFADCRCSYSGRCGVKDQRASLQCGVLDDAAETSYGAC